MSLTENTYTHTGRKRGNILITSSDIRDIFATITKGQTFTVTEIQDLVEKSYELSTEDWEPHTDSRPNNYPKWKGYVQSVLSDYKDANKIAHAPETHSYTF